MYVAYGANYRTPCVPEVAAKSRNVVSKQFFLQTSNRSVLINANSFTISETRQSTKVIIVVRCSINHRQPVPIIDLT